MDLNGPAGNAHFRTMHHQHDEVRLIDYARLTEHLSPRKIILLQLFRTVFRRLVSDRFRSDLSCVYLLLFRINDTHP